MKTTDPIASATLAHLYVGQGHVRQAREILRQVLARDPFDGHALCLAERLRPTAAATLQCEVARHSIELKWRDVPVALDLHAVVVTIAESGRDLRTRVTSVRCREPGGTWSVTLPAPRGSVTACLGRLEGRRGFVAHAVADPCSWDGA